MAGDYPSAVPSLRGDAGRDGLALAPAKCPRRRAVPRPILYARRTMADPTPFPTLSASLDDWSWPAPPFKWPHEPPASEAAQPCVIETRNGSTVEGHVLNVDPIAGLVSFRGEGAQAAMDLPFARFSRLTLTEPLVPVGARRGALPEHAPVAAEERPYRLHRDLGAPLEGRTLGSIESDEMLLLWSPVDGGRSLQRMLVPRSAYQRSEFGPSAEEAAARRWVATPDQLLKALSERGPVLPIGEALLDLGFVTARQLEDAMAQPADKVPLGERLVALGMLSRSNLHTALAYKVGMPLVDVNRFPLSSETVQLLPRKIAVNSRALPLMLDGMRLIVAVDRPSRIDKLLQAQAFTRYTLVPVLAQKNRILMALARLARQDVWADSAMDQMRYFATTS